MGNQKVVITGTIGVVTPEVLNWYKKRISKEVPGVEVEFLEDLSVSDDKIIEGTKGATVILTQFQNMNDKIYKALGPDLRAVCAQGIGTDTINPNVAAENGVLVANVPDYCQNEVAIHTVSLILAAYRDIQFLIDHVREGNWGGSQKRLSNRKRFSEYTIGLYGFGAIPKVVAKMLSGFGVDIISADPFVSEEDMNEHGVKKVTFDELLEQSDFLSLHAPLLPDTEGVFNKEAFKKMKKSVHIINTARGGLVDPQAMYDALTNGEIEYAALDAFITEPPTGAERDLVELDNTLITPHVGYYSKTAMDEMLEKAAQNVIDILKGKMPKYAVNASKIDNLPWLDK